MGGLPVILMELNNSGDIVKTYIYANSQIIAQHTGDHEADRYFYLHDRLGSVRQIIDTSGNVKNRYTYDPFGELYPAPDFEETVDNPFKFTGQYFDSEIKQYYLRARQYDPHIARFTARDPVFGRFQEPLTLHVYLYCLNDPVNNMDPTGELTLGGIGRSTAFRAFLFNSTMTAMRGGSASEIVLAGLSGALGQIACQQVTASLTGAGFFAKLLGNYAQSTWQAIGGFAGGGTATILNHLANEGELTSDPKLWIDVFTSGLLGSYLNVYGSGSEMTQTLEPLGKRTFDTFMELIALSMYNETKDEAWEWVTESAGPLRE